MNKEELEKQLLKKIGCPVNNIHEMKIMYIKGKKWKMSCIGCKEQLGIENTISGEILD